MTSVEVRSELAEALKLDLIGPDNDHVFATELLPDPPSRWYLSGFLIPTEAPIEQRSDPTDTEELDFGGDAGATDDASPPDRAAARKSILPSSMGVSALIPKSVKELRALVQWGDYIYEGATKTDEPADTGITESGSEVVAEVEGSDKAGTQEKKVKRGYRRTPREEAVAIVLPEPGVKPVPVEVPNSGGLILSVTARPVTPAARLPAGTKSVSIFLVNKRKPDLDRRYKSYAFQARLIISASEPLVPRPDLRGWTSPELATEWDDRVADLQYRDVYEFAVGHGVSAEAQLEADGKCFQVRTVWMPTAEVERIAPAGISGVELRIEELAKLSNGNDASAKLMPIVEQYRAWINEQKKKYHDLDEQRAETAHDLLTQAGYAADRIEAGINALKEDLVLCAFKIANSAMAAAARRREAMQRQTSPELLPAPVWRPFQLAFILMTLRSIVNPLHGERELVDLLFFPTGGGKTEAYLGLAAFTMIYRRLTHRGIRSAGMSVLMRYTLRLLTLDQLGRAAALMCALELEREKDREKLGEWPFEIGLWVGSAATPNRMGHRGYNGPGADNTAYSKTMRFMRDERNPSPIPLENCPWCGTKFTSQSFRLVPNVTAPTDLRVHCVNHKCEFTGDRWLPILGVDEPIYRRLPAFVIATVDKFAGLPWTGRTGTLFGFVDRYDQEGFYGPCDPRRGTSLDGNLLGPDLIIQDELHLISGPLGTIAGIYETAIDELASRIVGERKIRPKIVASTATVRRADSQIRALFERNEVAIFPPPGPDRRDSFFAKTDPPSASPARLYVGVAAQGRSLKVVLLRSSLALLSAAQTLYRHEGGRNNHQNPVDPYMTLLGYFNSLRELGGSRRIIEDEVRTRVAQYGRRRRLEPTDELFSDRTIQYDVLELTSRVSTAEVATNKRRLTQRFHENDRVDVALATNMISVGLDILRLGLMVVLGQPKTSAEYIQATSRVGRDPGRPGLIVTLLNIHKPRDRSHYERFCTYHATFYRAVEPMSVTPFSPRALDRALAAALVALSRQGNATMTPALGAMQILSLRNALTNFAIRFADRASNHKHMTPEDRQALRERVLHRCISLLDDWVNIATQFRETNTSLQYQQEVGAAKRLLYEPLDPELAELPALQKRFRANRSMRDVEPTVDLTVKNLNDWNEQRPAAS
jgi:hypothetical protein